MQFEWDPAQNRSNWQKHGVSFELASEIFEGRILSLADLRYDYGEVRMTGIGASQPQGRARRL